MISKLYAGIENKENVIKNFISHLTSREKNCIYTLESNDRDKK